MTAISDKFVNIEIFNKMSSPTPSQSDTGTSGSTSSDSEISLESCSPGLSTKCLICQETYTMPRVLNCFHTFCQPCIEKQQDNPERVICPECNHETYLGSLGASGLMQDYAVSNILETSAIDANGLHCTGCKSKDTTAVAKCYDCANFLCANCVMAHQFMHCFEGHRVLTFTEVQGGKEELQSEKPVACPRHRHEVIKFFCKTCSAPICKECTLFEHGRGHECHFILDVSDKQVDILRRLSDDAKAKASDLRQIAKGIEHINSRLQIQYQKAQEDITETYNFFRAVIEERKQEVQRELDQVFNGKQIAISTLAQKIQENIERIYQGCDFIDKLLKHASSSEILLFKSFIEQRFQNVFNFQPDINNQNYYDMEFISNFSAIQVGIQNTFGYVRQNSEFQPQTTQKPQPIARPANGIVVGNTLNNGQLFETSPRQFSSTNNFQFGGSTDNNIYEKWSSGLDIFTNGMDIFPTNPDPLLDLTSKLINTGLHNSKQQIKRQKMIYHCKFGEFGTLDGQFTEPSGVAVNAQNDVIVADTNNHRIQIFDKDGRFKFQFGECGKRDGQLLYPNRVAVVRSSGDIIVTERSPTHQIQIYNQYGQFVRKFGANILQHPRGVTVDNKGRIVIVECKVMRVIIFDQMGNVLYKFGCSQHLEFPNGVVVNDKEEIFISDNRAHCVKVFNYQGLFLRQIGGEGVTNYPIGVGINSAGEVLIADNHNNFNLTIFTQDGQLVNALESKVKHAQCFDVALMDDGSVVLASKDYRVYIYRYAPHHIPALGM
ncbi:brain tumor ncl-1-like [Argonauta hians]